MAVNDAQTGTGGVGADGGVATGPADLISYEDLYARWEQGNWSATELDFREDARQWREELTAFERRAALWNYALFLWGEDAVADTLSPYIDAAPREEQRYFLATQQVDEARHAVFFTRFMHEVCGVGDGTAGAGLRAIEPQLTWGFRKIFDRLDAMARELRRDRSRERLSAAVTLYHMVVEATLAQPGQHFITSYLTARDMLPAFRAGMEQVARDEQRHIGFGVKLLSELAAPDERCRRAVADLLREITAWTPAVLMPPGGDRGYTEVFGFTLEEIGEAGVTSLRTKLRSAGLPLERLPGPPILPHDLSAREIAERGPRLVAAGLLGPAVVTPPTDGETVALVMDTIARQLPVDGPALTVQLDFVDVDPWLLRFGGGAGGAASAGRSARPDVTLRASWRDWLDVAGGRRDSRRALLERRLRIRVRWASVRAALPALLGGR